jgi:hypothetical protein
MLFEMNFLFYAKGRSIMVLWDFAPEQDRFLLRAIAADLRFLVGDASGTLKGPFFFKMVRTAGDSSTKMNNWTC